MNTKYKLKEEERNENCPSGNDTLNKNYQTKYDLNKERKKMNHTYPELYTAGAVLVKFKSLLMLLIVVKDKDTLAKHDDTQIDHLVDFSIHCYPQLRSLTFCFVPCGSDS